MATKNVYSETGLIVYPRCSRRDKMQDLMELDGWDTIYDEENDCFFLPNDEESMDCLESALSVIFKNHNISASFEAYIHKNKLGAIY